MKSCRILKGKLTNFRRVTRDGTKSSWQENHVSFFVSILLNIAMLPSCITRKSKRAANDEIEHYRVSVILESLFVADSDAESGLWHTNNSDGANLIDSCLYSSQKEYKILNYI